MLNVPRFRYLFLGVFLFLHLTCETAIIGQDLPQRQRRSPDDNTDQKNYCPVSEADVLKMLSLTYPNYTLNARPRKNSDEVVDVKLQLAIYGIKDFLEAEGTIVVDGFLRMDWHDDFYQWNDLAPYSCVKLISVQPGKVWNPGFVIFNDRYTDFRSSASSAIFPDGLVSTSPHGLMAVSCEVDSTLFPFDTQLCGIHIESWDYDSTKVNFSLFDPPFPQIPNLWLENRQWQIIGNSSYTHFPTGYGDGTYFFARASFYLLLRRKPLFYNINIIFPSVIISVVELVVFVLPNTEDARLSISVTCLLAYSIFQGMIIGDMPRSGAVIPLLSIYIDLQMAYIGIIAILGGGLVYLISSKSETESITSGPPRWLFRVALFFGAITGVRLRDSVEPAEIIETKETNNKVIHVRPATAASVQSNTRSKRSYAQAQWLHLANVFDRLTLLTYLLAIIITPIAMFGILPVAYKNLQTLPTQ